MCLNVLLPTLVTREVTFLGRWLFLVPKKYVKLFMLAIVLEEDER